MNEMKPHKAYDVWCDPEQTTPLTVWADRIEVVDGDLVFFRDGEVYQGIAGGFWRQFCLVTEEESGEDF